MARGQSGVDVARGQPRRAQDVLGELLALQSGRRHGGVGVGDVRSLVGGRLDHARSGRPGPSSGLEVHHRLQRLELHVHEARRVLGLCLGLGHHQRHGLAGVDHLLARERLVQPALAGGDDGQIGRGEHGDHPGEGRRLLGLDAGDHRVGLVGQDEPGVKQPGDRGVAGELRRAPDLGLGITTRSGDADRGHSATLAPRRSPARALLLS